jgi:sortase A
MLLGLLSVGFIGYLFGFTGFEAYRSQHFLAQQLGGSAGLAALNGRSPAAGQPVAIIALPSLGVRQVVVEGTSAQDLELGPGLLIGSAPPGTAGNVVIAGHRSTFGAPFGHLSSLMPGATIDVTGALGRFEYAVVGQRVVRPGQPLPASPTSSGRLTLVTSASAGLGNNSLLVVTADLRGKPVARVPLAAAAVPPANFGLSGDSSALTPALVWGEGLLVTLGVAWFLTRRSKRVWLVYGIAAPIVVALSLLLFGAVATLLPATM